MDGFSLRRFVWAPIVFAAVLVVGTIGFRLLLDEGWSSSFYRSVVTTTLTGLDTKPEGTAAELFSIGLLLAGVAVFLYIAGTVVELVARSVTTGAIGERRRRRAIDQLRNHTIICGFGRVGRRVADELEVTGAPYVVLDMNPASLAAARERNVLAVDGDGTRDNDLHRAGLPYARALVAASDSDESNVFIVLSARAARPELFIVARASDESAARKLRLAGANRTVDPYSRAGLQIANLVLKPQVADYLDIVSTAGGPELRFEEIELDATCQACGRTIRDLRIRDVTGALVIAVRKADGTFDATPSPDAELGAGDIVIGVGATDEIRRLEQLLSASGAVVG